MATRTNERTVTFTGTISKNTAITLGLTLHATENIIGVKNASSNAAEVKYTATSKSTHHVYFCDSAKGNEYQIYQATVTVPSTQTSATGTLIPYPTSVLYPTKTLDCPNLKGKALYWYCTLTGTLQANTSYLNKSFIVVTQETSYTLSSSVSPASTGTVTLGATEVYQGDSISISASPASGYKFSSWTVTNGTVASSTSASTTVTIGAGNCTVTASFVKQSYTLTTAVSPSGYGTVTAGATLEYQATKSLTATANTGRYFSSWSKTAGTLSSTTTNPTTFTMGAGAATVTANFGTNSYTLTVSKGTGISSVSGGGSKAYGSSNAISATVSTGYTFSTWSSNNGGTFANAGSASTNFTMPAGNVTVTASATVNSYTLTVAKGTGVSALTGGGSKAYGSSNAITATMSTGYSFVNWTSNNGGTFANANSSSTNFTMPAGNVTVTANGKINSYTLTTAVSPTNKGCSVTAGGSLDYGATKSLTATAGTGYTFSSWSKTAGTLSSTTTNPTTFTMGTSAATVTANFTVNSYTLTTTVTPSGGGTVTAGGSLNYEATKSLTATASTGYTFSKWTKTAGSLSSTTTNPTTFTMGAGNATVTAEFTINSYTLTTTVSPSGGGSVTAGGSLNYNATKSLTATPATGYSFVNWTKTAGSLSSTTTNPTTFTMGAGAATVTANFNHDNYSLTGAASPSAGGSVTLGAANGYYNDQIAITATPSTGYAFVNWSTTGGTIANVSSASTSVTMPTANITVTAVFEKINYIISADTNPSGAGTITTSPANTANYGDTVTVSQIPAVGYAFDDFSISPEVTLENNSFVMPANNVTITGNYHLAKSLCSLDKSSYTGGDTAILSITYYSNTFSHRYKLDFGGNATTGWVPLAAGVDTANIYIPIAWCMILSSTYTTGGTLTLETYDGQALLGTSQVTGLSYNALDSIIPNFKVWRCNAEGDAVADGVYAKYSITKPSTGISRIYIGESYADNTPITGDILPSDRRTFATSLRHNIQLSLIFTNETITITEDIPKVNYVRKYIVNS